MSPMRHSWAFCLQAAGLGFSERLLKRLDGGGLEVDHKDGLVDFAPRLGVLHGLEDLPRRLPASRLRGFAASRLRFGVWGALCLLKMTLV